MIYKIVIVGKAITKIRPPLYNSAARGCVIPITIMDVPDEDSDDSIL